MEICGDNRFEIIAKAKADLLEGTNIETDEAEMAVIDNILFRCWQMGWLDRYDRKTEPQMEKEDAIYWLEVLKMHSEKRDAQKITEALNMAVDALRKTEPTISKMEQVDKPQTDCYVSDLCKHYGDKQICGRCRSRNLFCEAEPQPRCPKCGKRGYIRSLESMGVKLKVFDEYKWKCTNCNKYFKEEPKDEDEPQTEADWKDEMWTEAVQTERSE